MTNSFVRTVALQLCAIALVGATGAPVRAQSTGQDWATEETNRILSAPPTLANLTKIHWYQIPVSDLSAHNVPRDVYLREFKPKLDAYALSQVSAVKEALQAAFDGLSYTKLEARHRENQPIDYCRWIPATRSDGAIASPSDLQAIAEDVCQKLAQTRITTLVMSRIVDMRVDLPSLKTLDFEYPRWITADADIDNITSKNAYLSALKNKLDGATQELLRNVDGAIDSNLWLGGAILSPKDTCKAVLGNAFSSDSVGPSDVFQSFRMALGSRCFDRAHAWLMKIRPDVINATKAAIAEIDARAPIKSERRLCYDIERRWLSQTYYPTEFKQPIDAACLAQATTTVADRIAARAQQFVERIESLPATLDSLQRTGWFAPPAELLADVVARDDDGAPVIRERVEQAYDALVMKYLDRAVSNANNEIVGAFDAAVGDQSAIYRVVKLCGADWTGGNLAAASRFTAPYRDRVVAACKEEMQQFAGRRIELVMNASHVKDLGGSLIISGSQEQESYRPEFLVAEASLSGLQVSFESARTGVGISVTPIGTARPRLEGWLQYNDEKSTLRLIRLDSLPSFPVSARDTLACLALSKDQASAVIIVAALSTVAGVAAVSEDMPNTGRAYMGQAARLGIGAFSMSQCLQARESFAGNGRGIN